MTSTQAPLEERVTGLIREALGIEVPSPGTDMIDTGLVDSLAVVTLITEIEMVFERQLPLDALDLDSFRSVERICALLAQTETGGGD